MSVQVIELQEYRTRSLEKSELPESIGRYLWSQYKNKIQVEAPSFQNDQHWQLTPQGWAGHFPLGTEYSAFIKPKVELSNIFRMLEYAYKLKFLAEGDMVGGKSLREFYERLANILAQRVLDRSRKGFYREYATRANRLPYLRGKVALESMLRSPWKISLDCRYHESTADIEENQILAWTLSCIARTGLCREGIAKRVRRAYRAIQGIAHPKRCLASLCEGRHYNRLNEDYQSLHVLCWFFLKHSGPSHEHGNQSMLPFLIDMAQLFEMFVAEWLREHLPENILLEDQHTIRRSVVYEKFFWRDANPLFTMTCDTNINPVLGASHGRQKNHRRRTKNSIGRRYGSALYGCGRGDELGKARQHYC